MITVQRDRYGFSAGKQMNKIAALIDQGLTDDEIVKRNFGRQQIHTTRYMMKKRMKDYPTASNALRALKQSAAPKANGVIKRAKPRIKGRQGVSRANFPEKFDAYGFRLGSQLSDLASRIAGGETSAALVRDGYNKFQVYKASGRVARGPTNKHALPALIGQRNVATTNGIHEPGALVPKKRHPPKHIEMVLHDGRGNEIPIFAESRELLDYLLPRVMRKIGLG